MPTVNLKGHVFDSKGRPLRGATVVAYGGAFSGSPLATTSTNADGEWSFENLDYFGGVPVNVKIVAGQQVYWVAGLTEAMFEELTVTGNVHGGTFTGTNYLPKEDNLYAVGSLLNRFKRGYFSEYLHIGSPVAASGALRLGNGLAIAARNSTNTGDITIITTATDNRVIVGNRIHIYSSGGVYIGSAPVDPGAGNVRVDGVIQQLGNSNGRNEILSDGTNWYHRAMYDHLILQGGYNDANPRQVHIRSGNSKYGIYVGTSGGVHIGSNPSDPGADKVRIQGRLYLPLNTDVSSGNDGNVTIGPTNGANISFDGNEIMARNNGQPSTLYLNHEGGEVRVNNYPIWHAGNSLTVKHAQMSGGDYTLTTTATGLTNTNASLEPGIWIVWAVYDVQMDAADSGQVFIGTLGVTNGTASGGAGGSGETHLSTSGGDSVRANVAQMYLVTANPGCAVQLQARKTGGTGISRVYQYHTKLMALRVG